MVTFCDNICQNLTIKYVNYYGYFLYYFLAIIFFGNISKIEIFLRIIIFKILKNLKNSKNSLTVKFNYDNIYKQMIWKKLVTKNLKKLKIAKIYNIINIF